jgi:iron complex outermembrane receptor protein
MKPLHVSPLFLAGLLSPFAQAAEPTYELPPVQVHGTRAPVASGVRLATPSAGHVPADVAEILTAIPGAAVVRNGALTGIVQVRGLFNDRINTTVDGMDITPACPNHMDPPLHYAAPAEVDHIAVIAGIAPVSAGGDSLGAVVAVKPRSPAFHEGDGWRAGGRLSAGVSGANRGGSAALEASLASRDTTLAYQGSRAAGDDLRIPGGRVRASGYDSTRHRFSLARRLEAGRFSATLGQHRARDAGTPALPMDMVVDDADWLKLGWQGQAMGMEWDASAYWHDITHVMDNYSLRPNGGAHTYAPADSTDLGASLAGSLPLSSGRLRLGAEWRRNESGSAQWAQGAAVPSRDILRDAWRERAGLFAEWEGVLRSGLVASLGIRAERVSMDTGNIRYATGAAADANAFNARSHGRSDSNTDWALLLRQALSPELSLEGGVARKTRSPSLLEHYEWTPFNASAGQADGKTYKGNLDLRPEISHQASLGLAYRRDGLEIRPSLFYQRVRDFIQGMPVAGQVYLQYQNVDAELWGADGSVSYTAGHWRVSGTLSQVRGSNRSNDDHLYRLAPLNGRVEVTHEAGAWQQTLTLRAAARQDRVAAYNGETPSGGYGVLDLRLRWQAAPKVEVVAGVDNLADRHYVDHLGGVNRVTGSDVAVGERIPGAGRFLHGSVSVAF